MAEELVEKCSKLQIKTAEDEIVVLDDGIDDSHDEKLSLRLVGRVLTKKPLNFDAVKRTLHAYMEFQGGCRHPFDGNQSVLVPVFPLER